MKNRTSPTIKERICFRDLPIGEVFTLQSQPQVCWMKVRSFETSTTINAIALETGTCTTVDVNAMVKPQPDIYFGGDLKV